MANEVHNSSISISRLYSNQYQKSGYKFLQSRLIKFQRGSWIVSYRPSAGLRMHNTCCASAYQLLCKRTTAVVRPTELISPITYIIFSDNFICLFRKLLPYSAIVSYALSFDIIRLRVFNNAIILIIR